MDRLLEEVDEGGRRTRYEYDPQGRVTRMWSPDSKDQDTHHLTQRR
ncbi:MAG: RHS repeat domain-containing protein [Sedimenticola sp.]